MKKSELQQIKFLAEEVLSVFAAVEDVVESILSKGNPQAAKVLIRGNSMADPFEVVGLVMNQKIVGDAYRLLKQAPANSRIVVKKEGGKERALYVCSYTPPFNENDKVGFTNYMSPMGRLAELDPGDTDEVALPKGEAEFTLISKAGFAPIKEGDGWDSKPVDIKSIDALNGRYGSLRFFLPSVYDAETEKLSEERRLAEHERIESDGRLRRMLDSMELRSQPILDKFQGKIFRLPLNTQLMIVGPPGTGKTTTLIKRLKQKVNLEYLNSAEKSLVERAKTTASMDHVQSWIMFTPTDLLKQYLTNAFARESVPATDQHIQTWDNYRRDVSRNKLRLMRTDIKKSGFVRRGGLGILTKDTANNPWPWFLDFIQWLEKASVDEIDASIEEIMKHGPQATKLAQGVLNTRKAKGVTLLSNLLILSQKSEDISALRNDAQQKIDEIVDRALGRHIRVNNDFIPQFQDELRTIAKQIGSEGDLDAEADVDAEEELDEVTDGQVSREEALRAYSVAVQAYSRAAAKGRKVSQLTKAGRTLEWLGDRGLSDEESSSVGSLALLITALRRLHNPYGRYVDSLSRRYREYRRIRTSEGKFYEGRLPSQRNITDVEIDLLILSTVTAVSQSLSDPRAPIGDISRQPIAAAVLDVRRNQVLVDEATDFSILQLATMWNLCSSVTKSFFACGDVRQRVTEYGIRDLSNLREAIPSIGIEEIDIPYRQSKQLNELAMRIAEITGAPRKRNRAAEKVLYDACPPVLGRNLKGLDETCRWISERIAEIEQSVGSIPPIAVLVSSDDAAEKVAKSLNEYLEELNLRAVPSREGKFVGEQNDVRVFDVRYIKGLEFEAVFFLDVDKLISDEPDLYDKFLYVGTTRAATFLGLTCSGDVLPEQIRPLSELFQPSFVGQ